MNLGPISGLSANGSGFELGGSILTGSGGPGVIFLTGEGATVRFEGAAVASVAAGSAASASAGAGCSVFDVWVLV